jgi:putative ABC transport system permease protein
LGDRFTIKTVQGTREEFYTLEVAGISDGRRYSIQPSIFVPFRTWEEVRPKANLDDNNELIFNVVAVKLADPTNRDQMKQQLTRLIDGLEAADIVTAYESTPGYGPQQSTLSTQRTFTLLIGILVIGGFFQIQTLQKVAQIGMLKAIGASNLTVGLAALVQIVLVTILGVVIGALGTLALSLILPAIIPVIFTPASVITAIVTLLAIGPLGGLVSIRIMLKVEPLTALGLAA